MGKSLCRKNGSHKRDKTHAISHGHLPMMGGQKFDPRPRKLRNRSAIEKDAIAREMQR